MNLSRNPMEVDRAAEREAQREAERAVDREAEREAQRAKDLALKGRDRRESTTHVCIVT